MLDVLTRRAIFAAAAWVGLGIPAGCRVGAKPKKGKDKRRRKGDRVSATAVGLPKLVRDWYFTDGGGASVNYASQVYRPRSFRAGLQAGNVRVDDAGAFAGWDLLVTGIQTGYDKWCQVRLVRDASVALIWRGGGSPPAAYSNWNQDGTVRLNGTTYPVYRRPNPVGAGEASFAGAGAGKAPSHLLFAEADGTPTPDPEPWDGQTINPGSLCPQSLHDSWTTTGPNGATYATWHPLFDDVYHCSYGHEHGVDPALVSPDWHPAFGYSGEMTEGHAGFKVGGLAHEGKRLGFLIHFGTASPEKAVCLRYHSLDYFIVDVSSGEVLLDTHMMADFGKALANKDMPWGRFYTPACHPNQQDIDGLGHRQIPADGTNTGYYPWRADLRATLIGEGLAGVNNPDSLFWCDGQACAGKVPAFGNPNNTESGSTRFFFFFDPFSLGAVAGVDGEFCTNMHATEQIPCSEPGALRQYVKSGFVFDGNDLPGGANSGHCHNVRGWVSDLHVCGVKNGTKLERENTIPTGGPN